jgi:8-oxo-dGTP pyrophosphatase MutT (NUDIX family)
MPVAEPRLAATVLLLRPAAARFEVFLVERSRAVAFMPSAWVFPGGRVDPADALPGHPGIVGGRAGAALGLPPDEARAVLVGAVRETFEESGIWLGERRPDDALRAALCRREQPAALADVLAASGARIDLDRLIPWSRWITPTAEPRRYDTWFFAAIGGEGDGVHDAGETVASRWFPIDAAVAAAERGDLPMAPPTWWTLRQLAALPDLDALPAREADLRPITPILEEVGGALGLVLPGHPRHPDPARTGLPASITFGQGRWWARG